MRTTAVGVWTVAVVVVAIAAPSAFAAKTATVNVRLKEFKVLPSTHVQKAGKVTFVVKNVGKINHEMVVVKTNVPPGKLKENAEHEVSERGAVGEAPDVHPGQTKKVTLTLAPGKYQLLCNVAGHYKAGQSTGFNVVK